MTAKRLKADFHIHTAEDPEDLIYYDAKQLVEMAARQGYEVLAITNHNRCTWSPWLRDFAKERGICLVSGMEATVEGRHVVLLNFDFDAAGMVSCFSDLHRLKAEQPRGLILAPHPFYPSHLALRRRLVENHKLFDAVEWCHYYGRGLEAFNKRAESFARKQGLCLVGTSDAHQRRQFGTTYSLVESEPDPDEVVGAIRRGLVEVVTRPLSLLDLVRINLVMTVRNHLIQRLPSARNGRLRQGQHT